MRALPLTVVTVAYKVMPHTSDPVATRDLSLGPLLGLSLEM